MIEKQRVRIDTIEANGEKNHEILYYPTSVDPENEYLRRRFSQDYTNVRPLPKSLTVKHIPYVPPHLHPQT